MLNLKTRKKLLKTKLDQTSSYFRNFPNSLCNPEIKLCFGFHLLPQLLLNFFAEQDALTRTAKFPAVKLRREGGQPRNTVTVDPLYRARNVS